MVGLTGGALGIGASRHEPVIPPGTMVGVVPVGGLTPEAAAKRMRLWWDTERLNTIAISGPKVEGLPETVKWAELGLKIDDQNSVAQITLEDFWGAASRTLGVQNESKKFEPVFVLDSSRFVKFDQLIKSASSTRKPAKAQWDGKAVVLTYEVAPMALDQEALGPLVESSWRSKATEIELPTKADSKSVPDDELEKIKEVVSTFTTKFPTYKTTRCNNIKLASTLIDGHVLMPGESFSFNEFLGPRTIKKGFQVAGVFANGRHDTGVGGGICQVSTTLYNAAVFAGLRIDKRNNHSMAVPYVPVGRDAAVSYPMPDLKFTNTFDFPIALDSKYTPGTLTFTIVGIKDKSVEIQVERGPLRSWSRGVRYEHDGSLPYGKVRLVDAGGAAHQVTTYRIFKKDGKVVKREVLAVSQYPGSPRTYAKNMKAGPATAKAPPSTAPTAPSEAAPSLPNPD